MFRLLLASLALAFAAAPASAARMVSGSEVTFRWAPASGPVFVYGVWISRNGARFTAGPQEWVGTTGVTVAGGFMDEIVVKVAAFDTSGKRGPLSLPSETVLLIAEEPPSPSPPAGGTAGDSQSPADAQSPAEIVQEQVERARAESDRILQERLEDASERLEDARQRIEDARQ